MKKFFYLAIFAVCLGGCSSSQPAANDGSANVRTNVDISELNNPTNLSVDPNSNSLPPGNTWTDANGNPIVISKKADGTAKGTTTPPNTGAVAYPAPDNSEITSGTNKEGTMFETRTFKNNPTLVKIEKVYADLENPSITAYLKNGQKADLTLIKIEDPMKTSAQDIINAINAAKSTATTKQNQ